MMVQISHWITGAAGSRAQLSASLLGQERGWGPLSSLAVACAFHLIPARLSHHPPSHVDFKCTLCLTDCLYWALSPRALARAGRARGVTGAGTLGREVWPVMPPGPQDTCRGPQTSL